MNAGLKRNQIAKKQSGDGLIKFVIVLKRQNCTHLYENWNFFLKNQWKIRNNRDDSNYETASLNLRGCWDAIM